MRREFLILLGALLWLTSPAKGQFTPPALPGTFGDISTPSVNPPSGATRVYTKGGTVCSLDPSGSEKCTGAGGGTVIHSIGATFDGGGSAMTAGKTVYVTVPFSCTIQAWNITVDTGTATIDVWKIATGTAIPTVSNTITASATPAIASGTAIHSTSLTGWTTSVSANDIFGINLKVVSSATQASLVIQCQ